MEGALPACGLAVSRELTAVAGAHVSALLREVEELLAERVIAINQVNVFRRMHAFTPEVPRRAGRSPPDGIKDSTTRRLSVCLRLGVRVALAQPHDLPLTASMRRHPDAVTLTGARRVTGYVCRRA